MSPGHFETDAIPEQSLGHRPCTCPRCAVEHGDQAESPEDLEIGRLRAENAALKSERNELSAMVDRATEHIEADTAAMSEVLTEREWLEQAGNEICGLAFDIERANAAQKGLAMCAYCGAENLRQGDEMRAHAEACAKHPMSELRADVARWKADYLDACECVAEMHGAAVGNWGDAPRRGVVEDVEDLRSQRDAALAEVERLKVKVDLVINIENELCAQVADARVCEPDCPECETARDIAIAIRARSAK